MKQIIKDIFIEELQKCNNFNYHIKIDNLYLIVNTKKLYQSLIDNSYSFEGGIGSEWRFENYKKKYFYLSYIDIWSKFENQTKLEYIEIQLIVSDILEEGFKIKGIIPLLLQRSSRLLLEEGFKIKGIIGLK